MLGPINIGDANAMLALMEHGASEEWSYTADDTQDFGDKILHSRRFSHMKDRIKLLQKKLAKMIKSRSIHKERLKDARRRAKVATRRVEKRILQWAATQGTLRSRILASQKKSHEKK